MLTFVCLRRPLAAIAFSTAVAKVAIPRLRAYQRYQFMFFF